MKTKHTKGKWNACCLDATPHFVFAEDDRCVCAMKHNDEHDSTFERLEGIVTRDECRANAKLIAAAPELLNMLIKISNIENIAFSLKGFEVKRLKSEINDVIKKATA